MRNIFRPAFAALLLLVLPAIVSCGHGDGGSSTASITSRGQLLSVASLGTIGGVANGYALTYGTIDPSGALVPASGLILVPIGTTTFNGLMSVQHFTITHNADTPSAGKNWQEGGIALQLGMIGCTADYLGYGVDKERVHTYMQAAPLASASLDMIRACRAFVADKGYSVASKLMLMGYSEGGYATIALLREIEQNHPSEFSVTATAAGAGPYDMYTTTRALITSNPLPYPSFVAFVPYAYNATYGWNRPWSDFFNEPFASSVESLYNGSMYRNQIDAALTVDPTALFTSSTLDALRTGVGEDTLRATLMENNIYEWGPRSPVYLFHGVNDPIIPHSNVTTARDAFRRNGATDITMVDCTSGAGDHGDCGAPFFANAREWFKGYM